MERGLASLDDIMSQQPLDQEHNSAGNVSGGNSGLSRAGITPASVLASLFGMLAMGILIQISDINIGITFASEHTVALPAVWTLAVFLLINAVFVALFRWRVLTRAELLCVLFTMVISAPLMSQGFWHRVVAILASNPQAGDFDKLDAMNDRLWPHGQNLLADQLSTNNPALTTSGDCRWERIAYDEGREAILPVLVNEKPGEVSWIRIRVPAGEDDRRTAVPGTPYIASALVHASDLSPLSAYHIRVYADDGGTFSEFLSESLGPKKTYLHRTGFRRVGKYGTKFPAGVRDHYTIEFGLTGPGRVVWSDPKIFSVSALEGLMKGRKIVSEQDYAATPVELRADLLARPERMWSLKGAAFWLKGYIPVADWAGPVVNWTLFVMIVLTGVFALNVIFRKLWLDGERFQLPMARIPAMLIDDEEDDAGKRWFPSIWRNRLMWAGFAVGLIWLLLKAWHFYNPRVPDLSVNVVLQDYFPNPAWGKMWEKWRFEIEGVILSLAVFMELSVLLSLVLGYIGFKSLFWIGELAGWTADPRFPHTEAQGIGAYLGYALILLILSRKYLAATIRAAFSRRSLGGVDDGTVYRWAYLALLAAIVGGGVWAAWQGISPASMVAFIVFLIAIGLVSSRLRAECGTPWGYFAPANLALFLGLLGGVWRFGPEAMIFAYMASFMLGPTVFFLIPGAQMELLGLGRSWRVPLRQLVICAMLGVLGGMLIGGWVFLSNAYSLGGESSPYTWAFSPKQWYFNAYNQDLAAANSRFLSDADGASGFDTRALSAVGIAGVISIVLTLLRQCFSGFWFHPIGFILSSTNFMYYAWGSVLTAWVLRGIVLRFGGAATVRDKLQPFFAGVFLGTCLGYLLLLLHGAYLQTLGITTLYPILTQ